MNLAHIGKDRDAERPSGSIRSSASRYEYDIDQQLVAAMVGHELREPINAILSFLNVTIHGRLGPLNELQQEFLRSTETAARRLERRIDDVQIALLGGEALKLRCGWLNLNSRVIAACRELEWAAEKYEINVLMGLEQSSRNPGVWADPDRLDQILINLLENAIRYAPSGSEVRIRSTFKEYGAWTVIIDNETEPGYSGNPSLWFEPGHRIRPNDPERTGYGLGLTIARHLVEAHGGSIWAECDDDRVRVGFSIPHKTRALRPTTSRSSEEYTESDRSG